ncbi:EthD domain-containing protein [Penicillium hispanicum]|uniref:EthD domain-containing protein n=1 Tax=Penicillium hispanicum TaxID=1080232 RepID=UPI0025410E93|nr:EthD domain-containing protein [Penicillium hispanicum]KAJ5569881.1 EthD domain-containing protein [Penicillium hispanicum]
MSAKVIIYAYRKPGLSLDDFRKHYEAHAELIKRLTGDLFPLSHKRTYLARSTVETAPEDASPRNATTPATVIAGRQSDFDFDAYAELTFADQAALMAFSAKVLQDADVAAQIAADEEKFLDRSKIGIAMLGDVVETTK